MAKVVEVEESQFTMMQRAMALLDNVNKNPEARRNMEKAFKVLDPNLETEADLADKYAKPVKDELNVTRDELKALREEIAKDKAEAAEREQIAAITTAFDRIRPNYSDEALEKIKEIMVARKLPDVEAAALVFDKQNPPPAKVAQSSYEPDFYDMAPEGDTIEDTRLLFKNPDAWEDRKIGQVLLEERSRVAA